MDSSAQDFSSIKFSMAEQVAKRLQKIEGVIAITLGGSLARNEGHTDSDIDLGLYYDPQRLPSISDLNLLAAELDDSHSQNLITGFGEWGCWVNGGGWLTINKQPVDWLYRDISLVFKVIEDCQLGKTSCHYYPGHPHGFHDYYYLSEIYYCRPLCDPKGIVTAFKQQVEHYPPLLKKAIIEKYFWEASFSLKISSKSVKREDIFYVTGCLFRSIACLTQVIFALNEKYFINEKGSILIASSLALCPKEFKNVVTSIMSHPGNNEPELLDQINKLELLIEDTKKFIK